MSDLIKVVKDFCTEYSMEILLFISGLFGAALSDNKIDVKLTIKQRALRMFFGGITAVFSTHFVVEVLEYSTSIKLSHSASAGVGFYLGYLGLQGVTRVMISYSKINNGKHGKGNV